MDTGAQRFVSLKYTIAGKYNVVYHSPIDLYLEVIKHDMCNLDTEKLIFHHVVICAGGKTELTNRYYYNIKMIS